MKSVWAKLISYHFPITKMTKMTEKGVGGESFIIKRSFKLMKCLGKKGVHINHFIYKLVNKDILKCKLSKNDFLSDLWQCCNTGSAICDFVFLIT